MTPSSVHKDYGALSFRKALRMIALLSALLLMSACGEDDGSNETQAAPETETGTETDTQNGNVAPDSTTEGDPETPLSPSVEGIMTDDGLVPLGIIKDSTIGFSGNAASTHSVEVYMDGLFIGSALASSDGHWTFDYQDTPIETGQYLVTLASVGSDGQRIESESAFKFTYLPDTVDAPEILAISPDTGASADDGITSSGELRISGTATATVPVEVYVNGSHIGTVEADSNGNWTLDYSGHTLADGSYNLQAETILDDQQNATSVIYPVVVDSSVASPTMQVANDTGTLPDDGVTNDTAVTLTGNTEPGTTVDVYRDGTLEGTVTADADGDWSFDGGGRTLADGSYNYTAQLTDIAGNTADSETAFTVTVDTGSPSTSTNLTLSPDGGTDGDWLTNSGALTFSGATEAGAQVELFVDGGSIGTALADSTGQWQLDHTDTPLAEGTYDLTHQVMDPAGNLSALSGAQSFTIDATAPTVTGLTPVDDATKVALTSNLEMTFSEDVTVQSGDITLLRSDGSVFERIAVTDGSVSGSGTSTMTINLSSDLELGTDYYVNVDSGALADAAGNTYGGISNTTTWNFSAESDILLNSSSPADDSTGIALNTTLSLSFNTSVVAETGDLRVRKASDSSLFESIPASSDQVSGESTKTISVGFSNTLEPNTDYYVEIDGDAFSDGAGTFYNGIADTTTLNFQTANVSTPTVTDVSSSTADGTYGSAETIAITVTFSETVNVTDFPQIRIKLDGRNKTINYSSGTGTGTNTLTFAYEITPGDTSADLGYVDTNSLSRNGGAIRSDNHANADLTLPTPGTTGSLSTNKALVVDAYVLDITGMSAANGFFIRGQYGGQEFGHALDGAGDVNGDGYEDFLVSIAGYDQDLNNNASNADAGSVWLIFGQAGATRADIELQSLPSGDGIQFVGANAGDYLGAAAAHNGDLNGDGFDDIVMAAPHELSSDGRIYVIWGKPDIASLDLSTGWDAADGFRIDGSEANEHMTSARGEDTDDDTIANPLPSKLLDASGDYNSDGFNDLLIGHHIQDVSGDDKGVVYVILGESGASRSDIDLATLGTQGFRILNSAANTDDYLGSHARFIGDYNGDGYNDIFIGEVGSDASGTNAGRSYVVFGQQGASFSDIDVATLDGTDGFALTTGIAGSRLGSGMDSKDINGDGLTDLVIGQQYASPNGRTSSGKVTVIYGDSNGGPYPDIDVDTVSGSDGFVIEGETAGDEFGHAACLGDVDSDGIDDMVLTSRTDSEGGTSAGAAWVIYGHSGTSRGSVDLSTLDSVNGFKIVGDAAGDEFAKYCTLADINGNGYKDLLFVSPFGDDNATDSGETNVIWGRDFQAKAYGELTGNNAVNHIVGTDGDDTIATLGGIDTATSGAGADAISVSDLNFRRVDGGRGTDVLALDMSASTLDLTGFGHHQFRDLDVIDLSNNGNTLAVTANEVLAMTRESSELFVWGGTNDTVTDAVSSGWTNNGSITIGGVSYIEYVRDGATLFVEDTINNGGL